jgi:DNA processing protein
MAILKPSQFPFLLKQAVPNLRKLYYIGDISLLKSRSITFVGTRDITDYGKWVIGELLGDFLCKMDIVVVSGLARGVDAYVHDTCLKRAIKTMAIVPGAISSAIPKGNMKIFEKLKKEGLILAEYPEGTILSREMFVLRNRLLAAISDITIVIQAGVKSGSLITANIALDYNRDIYVIPGNINSSVSQGCNMLAKQGAGIITGVQDFKEILGIENDQVLLKT